MSVFFLTLTKIADFFLNIKCPFFQHQHFWRKNYLRGTIFKKGVKIGKRSKTCTSPLHILLREVVQILLFWNKSVDVPALISCWKNTFLVTLVITHFRSSTKKYTQKFSDNFLLSPLLKCFRKEKHFAKNQLCLCLQPLLLNFVPLNHVLWSLNKFA